MSVTGKSNTETCANCSRVIGKLETAHLWEGNVVCAACRKRLDNERSAAVINYAGPSTPPIRPEPQPQVARRVEQQVVYVERRRNEFSVGRVVGALLVIVGIPLMCVFFPAGLALFLLGALFMIAG